MSSRNAGWALFFSVTLCLTAPLPSFGQIPRDVVPPCFQGTVDECGNYIRSRKKSLQRELSEVCAGTWDPVEDTSAGTSFICARVFPERTRQAKLEQEAESARKLREKNEKLEKEIRSLSTSNLTLANTVNRFSSEKAALEAKNTKCEAEKVTQAKDLTEARNEAKQAKELSDTCDKKLDKAALEMESCRQNLKECRDGRGGGCPQCPDARALEGKLEELEAEVNKNDGELAKAKKERDEEREKLKQTVQELDDLKRKCKPPPDEKKAAKTPWPERWSLRAGGRVSTDRQLAGVEMAAIEDGFLLQRLALGPYVAFDYGRKFWSSAGLEIDVLIFELGGGEWRVLAGGQAGIVSRDDHGGGGTFGGHVLTTFHQGWFGPIGIRGRLAKTLLFSGRPQNELGLEWSIDLVYELLPR